MIQRPIGLLVMLLALALGARLAWELLSPVVPALIAVLALVALYGLLLQKWRR